MYNANKGVAVVVVVVNSKATLARPTHKSPWLAVKSLYNSTLLCA